MVKLNIVFGNQLPTTKIPIVAKKSIVRFTDSPGVQREKTISLIRAFNIVTGLDYLIETIHDENGEEDMYQEMNHGDMTPDNIMKRGNQYYIINFGKAKIAQRIEEQSEEEDDDMDHLGFCMDQLIYKSSQFACVLDLSYLSKVLDSIFFSEIHQYQIPNAVQGLQMKNVFGKLLSEEEHFNKLQRNGII